MRKLNIFLIMILVACTLLSGTAVASEKPVIVQIAAGLNHSLALDEDGNVYAFGMGYDGQLGLGPSVYETNLPTKISGLPKIVSIAAGQNQSFAIDENGDVWVWGRNNVGQLGLGDAGWNTNRAIPELNPYLSDIVQIAAGDSYTYAVDKKGHVYAWGFNHSGQLGFGDTNDRYIPEQISNLNGIKKISVGSTNVTFAIDENGDVWAWGSNANGILGMEPYIYNVPTPTKVLALNNIVHIVVGSGVSFALALDLDNNVWYWGDYLDGSTTFTPTLLLNGISQISIGYSSIYDYVVAIDEEEDVYSWGININGRLGLGDEDDRQAPVQIVGLSNASQIATGGMHAFAITDDGVYAWGYNFFGQLGLGDNDNRYTPTKIEFFASDDATDGEGDEGNEGNESQVPVNGDFLILAGLNKYSTHMYIRANKQERVFKDNIIPANYDDVSNRWN